MRQRSISLMFFALVAACGSDPAPPNPVCTAGTTNTCLCSGGSSGVQTCNSAGSGFGVCECGSPMDGGMLDSGPGPVCTAGTSQACSCTGGGTGTQACRADGTGYAACSCGSTCGAATCDGCCEGSVCRTGDVDAACGAGGVACDVCGADFNCDLDQECTLGFGTTWGVTITSAMVPTLDETGVAWDGGGGAPDIKVCVVTGDAAGTPYCTGEASDVFSATFTGGPTTTASPYEIASHFEIRVWDVDFTVDDPVGACTTVFDPSSPLPTTEQTMTCPPSAAFGYAGFTVRYQLSRI